MRHGRFLILIFIHIKYFTDHEINADSSYNHVTCGSLITLHNPSRDVYLHSSNIHYGQGNGQSGQRSVTGAPGVKNGDGYWIVKCRARAVQGTRVKCDDVIRLQHSSSRGHLRCHDYTSPLTHNKEICVYQQPEASDERSGDERTGGEEDNWEVGCGTKYWERGSEVTLRHVTSGLHLYIASAVYENMEPYPQHEVCGHRRAGPWVVGPGVFVQRTGAELGVGDEMNFERYVYEIGCGAFHCNVLMG